MQDSDEEDKIDKEKIQGYSTTKHKYTLGNVNDFISKMRKTKILQKFFLSNDPHWGGLQETFNSLYYKIGDLIQTDKQM